MKKYINTKTGTVIDSSFVIKGKHWIEESKLNKKEEELHEQKEIIQNEGYEEIDISKMKKDELIAFAKEHEIAIDEKSKKDVIIEVIATSFE